MLPSGFPVVEGVKSRIDVQGNALVKAEAREELIDMMWPVLCGEMGIDHLGIPRGYKSI